MKKLLYILGGVIALIVILVVVGGGEGEKKLEEAPTIYSINQNVAVGKAIWKLLAVEDKGSILKGAESKYPSWEEDKTTAGKFIEITLEVENVGEITESYISDPNLVDDKNREFKPATGVGAWIPEGKELIFADLQPNIVKEFVLIYEVSKDATGLKVKVDDISLGSPKSALIGLGL